MHRRSSMRPSVDRVSDRGGGRLRGKVQTLNRFLSDPLLPPGHLRGEGGLWQKAHQRKGMKTDSSEQGDRQGLEA